MSCQRCRSGIVANHLEVANVAKHAVLDTMAEGQAKHGDYWTIEPDSEDLEHIRAHLDKFEAGDTSEEHIEHSLTRLAFILARRARRANTMKSQR